MGNTLINYIEFQSNDLERTKQFYAAAFGWNFTDYGPTYVSFSNGGLEGGFALTEQEIVNGVLIVLYHKNLEEIKEKVLELGGILTKDIFSFPGGRRFHFKDPSGNELAIWSEDPSN